MTIREMRHKLGDTQREFAARYSIPFRTVQNWEAGVRKPPEYVVSLLETCVEADISNKMTVVLPVFSPHKESLPKRRDYVGALPWLQAVRRCLGETAVFALDEALMCQGNFGGHSDEYLVWVYGDASLSRFNGVVLLGNHICSYSVQKKNGLRYTDLSRTIADAFANESILDMQGITEALSKYYYTHGSSFDGISIVPAYQERFEKLAREAAGYYGE